MKKIFLTVFILLSVFVFPSKTFAFKVYGTEQAGFVISILCYPKQCTVHVINKHTSEDTTSFTLYKEKANGDRELEILFKTGEISLDKTGTPGGEKKITIDNLAPNTKYILITRGEPIRIKTDTGFDPKTAAYTVGKLEFHTQDSLLSRNTNPYLKGSISVTNPANYDYFNEPIVGFKAKLDFSTSPNFPSDKIFTVPALINDPTKTDQKDNKPGIAPDGTYYYQLRPAPLNPDTDYHVRETITAPDGVTPPEVRIDHFNTGKEYAAAGTVAAQQEFNLRSYRLLAPLPGISILMNPDLCAKERAEGRVIKICSVDEFIAYAIRFLIGLTAVILVGKLMWDGYNILVSDVPFLKVSAKSGFYTSLGGLALVLTSYLILNTVNPRLVSPGITLGTVTTEGEQRFTEQEALERLTAITTGGGSGRVPSPLSSAMKEGETRTFYATCYFVALESDYSGAKTAQFKANDGTVLENVSQTFYEHVAIEGTGLLSNGKMVGVDSIKKVKSMKDWENYRFRYVTRPEGKFGPVETLSSIAVDPKIIAPGSTVNIPSFVGQVVNYYDRGVLKSMTHSGIWYAKDIGGSQTIKDARIDLFTGFGIKNQKNSFCNKNFEVTIKKRGA